ncbi:MAG TPA: glycosyltransferase 87 family protein [Solirubrobacterales bacterium]
MDPGVAFALVWAGFLAYLGVLAAAPRIGRRPVWAAIAIVVTAFAVAPVILSHDVFSYVDYARLGVLHGLDPYVHPPATVPADPAFAEVDWTGATSAYGPLFTLATYPLAWLPVDATVAVLKALTAVAVLALAAIVARLATTRGIDPVRAAAFVALNPLVLVHVVGGAHNDAFAILLATAGVAAVLAARPARAGAAFAAAALIKPPAAFAFPFILASPPMGRNVGSGWTYRPVGGGLRVIGGAAGTAVLVAIVAYPAFGLHWAEALGLAGENQGRTSYMSIPILGSRLLGVDPTVTRAAALSLYGALVVGLLAWTWRGGDWVRAAAWAGFGLLGATAWLLPWYLIWALPLTALSRDRLLQFLVLGLTAYQLGARIPL